MSDPWDDEEETKPNTAVVKAEPVNPLAKIDKAITLLNTTIPVFEIKTAEDRAKTHDMRGEIKLVEKQIKEYIEDNITPAKTKIKRLEASLKPFKDKVNELVGVINGINEKWDTAKLKAEKEEKRKAQAKLDKEQADAMEKMVEAKKEGKPTPPAVLEKIVEVIPATTSAKIKSDKGSESLKLEWMWFIKKTDDTEWNRKERLNITEIAGYAGPLGELFCVDSVAINAVFNPKEKNGGLPHWIHVEERAKSSGFRG